ncbi:MAG: DUF2922 domain-containing protein [Oscillospiraceae bacterium]|nr:DUF2922 domain-containing protein [Oscillospiraceae bacterium]
MESITLKFYFKLQNGGSRVETIRDIKPNITESEILSLANSIIQKGAEYKGSKFSEFVKCEKVISSVETFYKK